MKTIKVLYKVDRNDMGSKVLCAFQTENVEEIIKEIIVHLKDELSYDYDSLTDEEREEEYLPTPKEVEEFARQLYRDWEIEMGFNMYYIANEVKVI
jgi:predicted amino acid racemase